MALNIISEAKNKMPGLNFAAIGPHILRDSFEVGRDVAEQLVQASPKPDPSLTVPAPGPGKLFFDLKRLAELQLATRRNCVRLFACASKSGFSFQFPHSSPRF